MNKQRASATKRRLIRYATLALLIASTISVVIALYFIGVAATAWAHTGLLSMPSLSTYWATPQFGDFLGLQTPTNWLWSEPILLPDVMLLVGVFCLYLIVISSIDAD